MDTNERKGGFLVLLKRKAVLLVETVLPSGNLSISQKDEPVLLQQISQFFGSKNKGVKVGCCAISKSLVHDLSCSTKL